MIVILFSVILPDLALIDRTVQIYDISENKENILSQRSSIISTGSKNVSTTAFSSMNCHQDLGRTDFLDI